MPLFERRPEQVTAEQWQPGLILPGVEMRQVAAFKVGRRKIPGFRTAAVNTIAGYWRLSPGDWIVYNRDGSRSVYPDVLFRKCFGPYRRTNRRGP